MTRVQTYEVLHVLPHGLWVAPTCAVCDVRISVVARYAGLGRCPLCNLLFCAHDLWSHGCDANRIAAEHEERRARWHLIHACVALMALCHGRFGQRQSLSGSSDPGIPRPSTSTAVLT